MYRFVFETPKPTDSSEDRRRAELQDSDARSHAAKIAYLKKRARQHVAQQQPGYEYSTRRTKDEGGEGDDRFALPGGDSGSYSAEPQNEWDARHRSARNDPRRRSYLGPGPGVKAKGNRVHSRAKFRVEPRSVLSQTSKDPFDAFPERRLPEIVEKVVQYAFDRIWPEMLCAVRGETLAIAKSEWKGHGLQDDLLFHVQVALACGLNLALQNVPKVSEALALARLSHYSKAIRLLKHQIESLDNAPASEDLMMSMLILGVNADVEQATPEEAHPASPLATSQYMHLYGRLTLMPTYATALHQLVEARGGIFKLRHLALADWLLLADLHHASRTGDRLRYPPIRPYYSIVASAKHILDAQAEVLSQRLGSGFHDLDDTLFTADLRDAVTKGVEATVALDHYYRYENRQPRLVDVMLAANEAQRTFLDLFPKKGGGLEHFVHECCRLSMLIFSDMVLFPMPSCTRIKPRLADELRHLLETFDDKVKATQDAGITHSTPFADMVLWALVLGGIAASFTDHRPWFVRRLRMTLRGQEPDKVSVDSNASSASASALESWPSFRDRVTRFLWWDPVVDAPARDLWEAATTRDAGEEFEKTKDQ
ncbi:hypothetical protein PV04_00164 [Phialophora macrospora]|uniref:Transcription factor domain-containing protein n=1 Tax=Phialophora macrospora TaxID=1851006 RepID=A0A0D2FU03_9EURO|nr:hypothetical protein PV04_00164 [Phialophora macrospora]